MSPPTKEVERLVLGRKLRHPRHPVLDWCISNTVVEANAAANLKPSEKRSREMIDLVVAMIMAIGAAMSQPAEAKLDTQRLLVV